MKKIFRRITVIVLAFVLFFAVEKIFPTISSDLSISSKFDSVQNFTAHRGLSNVAPENTAPALEEAGKKGYYAAESGFSCMTTLLTARQTVKVMSAIIPAKKS